MKRILSSLLFILPAIALADLHPAPGIANGSAPQNATFNVSSGTVTRFYASSATITHILGTVTNDTATAGSYGEYISSAVASQTVGTAAQYSDIASISLTAGDWDVSGIVNVERNGATFTSVIIFGGISLTSGNSGTGLVTGDTAVDIAYGGVALTFLGVSGAIPSVRKSFASTTTVYLKGYVDGYTAGTPQHFGRISARRMR